MPFIVFKFSQRNNNNNRNKEQELFCKSFHTYAKYANVCIKKTNNNSKKKMNRKRKRKRKKGRGVAGTALRTTTK